MIYDAAPAFAIFQRLETQWRVSSSAVIGLDCAAIESVMRMMLIPDDERMNLLDDVQIIEQSILKKLREKDG